MRNAITSPNASSVGPYSHAIDAGGTVFLSGQVPLDAATGGLIEGDIAARTQKCFDNVLDVLSAAGLTSDNVVKVTVFLTDMGDYAAMNEVYAQQFSAPYPARSAVAVAQLPLGSNIEIEMVAQR
ncbi:MAG: RidA family protein [Acidimicrobiales bacterium]|nr:RidA family protein [Acidimicrobiales bacterium]